MKSVARWAIAAVIVLTGCSAKASHDMLFAIKKNRPDVVQDLLNRGHPVEATKSGNTLLMVSSSGGKTEVVRVLINAGADVNAEAYGFTPLLLALKKGRKPVSALLIEKGANVNRDRYGVSPLMIAAEKNLLETIRRGPT